MNYSEMKYFKILLYKSYFDKGWAITNYFKYLFAFSGFFKLIDITQAIYIGIFYIIFCFWLGWYWFNRGIIQTENEINNVFNPFQVEIRKKLKGKKFK